MRAAMRRFLLSAPGLNRLGCRPMLLDPCIKLRHGGRGLVEHGHGFERGQRDLLRGRVGEVHVLEVDPGRTARDRDRVGLLVDHRGQVEDLEDPVEDMDEVVQVLKIVTGPLQKVVLERLESTVLSEGEVFTTALMAAAGKYADPQLTNFEQLQAAQVFTGPAEAARASLRFAPPGTVLTDIARLPKVVRAIACH